MGREEVLRAVRTSAFVAGGGFVCQTMLFLLVTTGVVGAAPAPTFVDTAATQEVDYATYYANLFNGQHEIVWNVVLRNAIGPVAWVGVGVLAVLSTRILPGGSRAWLAALLTCLGAALTALSDVVFGTLVGFWRYGGWDAQVPSDMIAAGRSYQGVKTVSTYLQYDGFVVVATAFVVWASVEGVSLPLRRLLHLTAVALVAYVVLDWVWPLWNGSQALRDGLALLLGVVLAPAVVVVWARLLRRHESTPRAGPGLSRDDAG